MSTMNLTKNDVKALRRLADMGERVINGEVWTKFSESKEFKVSPKGAEGDYDTGCYWVSYDELKEVV